jgi:hypothetical protein
MQRQAALQRAREQLDIGTCYVLAVELSALAYLERGEPAAQLAEFDRAMNGLVLTSSQAAASTRARGRIYTDWNVPQQPARPQALANLSAKNAQDNVAHASPASKSPQSSVAHASTASKNGRPDDVALQRALRLGAAAAGPAAGAAPVAPKAQLDEPILADGEFVITPQSAAAYASTRRGTAPRAAPDVTSAPPPAAAEWTAYRAAARELANAAVTERLLAATARKAAAAERLNAQTARETAMQAPDATTRAEIRATVAEHVEAADRYAKEAAEHSAAAAMHRTALVEHKALLQRMLGVPATAPGML